MDSVIKARLLQRFLLDRRKVYSENTDAIKAFISDGHIIDSHCKVPQGATFYEADCLIVSPKGKLFIKKTLGTIEFVK